MLKFLKIGLIILPWIGMFYLGYLYLMGFMNVAVAEHYGQQSFNQMAAQQKSLTDYVKSRRDFKNDKVAFQELDLILADQYNGKYEPWLRTKMGAVRFDAEGFIIAICPPSPGLNNPDCPPQL